MDFYLKNMKPAYFKFSISPHPYKGFRPLSILLLIVLSFLGSTGVMGSMAPLEAASTNGEFPVYPIIASNVAFWERIYTHYSTREAVVHDRHDLTKIYAVIPVVDCLQPGASQVNKPVLQAAEQKYAAILTSLAQRGVPINKEEQRVADMYKGASPLRLQIASKSVRVQMGQKERFRAGVMRSRTYLPRIKKIFRSYNLPEELAYLPHVESSFNPDAYSKVGASGLWQFTRSTGKQYLRITTTIDERRDPIISSHAAAKFLKRNHTVLGSWPLALTAYNYGTTGMAQAKKEKGSYEKIFREYQGARFKFASRNFYPEFLAALRSAQRMEQNFAVLQK